MTDIDRAIDFHKGQLKHYQKDLKPIPFASKRTQQEVDKILRKIKFTKLAIKALESMKGAD